MVSGVLREVDSADTLTVDSWTYLKRDTDYTMSSNAAADITGLVFTPAANMIYEFEALLWLRTATATVGPRPGITWPTGMTDGVAHLFMPTSATAQTLVFGNIASSLLADVGGLPDTTNSYPAKLAGAFMTGPTPSGNFRLRMVSETNGTTVTVKAGSFLKYRTI
jgi:hypothetical protein